MTNSDSDIHNLFIEYVIKVKDEKTSLTEREVSYEPLLLSKTNEALLQRVSEVVKRFLEKSPSEDSPEVTIRAKMVWQS